MKWARPRPTGLKSAAGFMSAFLNSDGGRLPFPVERAWLTRGALDSLMRANMAILDAGGRLVVTDMWRSPQEQMACWLQWATGRRTNYSPPPGASMHEIGRAVDLDLRDETTKIPAVQVVRILQAHSWVSIAPHGDPGSWHWEFRSKFLEQKKAADGYSGMITLAFEQANYRYPNDAQIDKPPPGDISQKHWL